MCPEHFIKDIIIHISASKNALDSGHGRRDCRVVIEWRSESRPLLGRAERHARMSVAKVSAASILGGGPITRSLAGKPVSFSYSLADMRW
jgi:hypothetical protein